jgi:hypothetical protein
MESIIWILNKLAYLILIYIGYIIVKFGISITKKGGKK